jgi:diguanylate cyclase (GGDEF)-like protein
MSEKQYVDRAAAEVSAADEIEALLEAARSSSRPDDDAGRLLQDRNASIHTKLIYCLTNERFDEDQSRRLWNDVLAHADSLSQKLGRNVGVRVAALDYFLNVRGLPPTPHVHSVELLEQLYRDALIDPLTGLPNRRHYRDRLGAEIQRTLRYREPFSLALVDLDDFKLVNDRHGHAAGDRVLQRVSELIRSCLREVDLAARWGGEEFVLLLPATPKSAGVTVADRVRQAVETSSAVAGGVTLSAGVAACTDDGDDEESLFAYADRCLYRAKSEGKNRVCGEPLERRAYARVDARLPLRLRFASHGPHCELQTYSVGGGGLAFHYHRPPVVGSEVAGELDVDGRTIRFLGRVVRVTEEGENRYDVGVEFRDMPPDGRERIAACIVPSR